MLLKYINLCFTYFFMKTLKYWFLLDIIESKPKSLWSMVTSKIWRMRTVATRVTQAGFQYFHWGLHCLQSRDSRVMNSGWNHGKKDAQSAVYCAPVSFSTWILVPLWSCCPGPIFPRSIIQVVCLAWFAIALLKLVLSHLVLKFQWKKDIRQSLWS